MIISIASIMCVVLVFIGLYRLLMSSKTIQRFVHDQIPFLAAFLQYYSLLYITLFILLIETIVYVALHMREVMISSKAVHQSLNDTLQGLSHMSQADRDSWIRELRDYDNLQQFSLLSPLAALLAFLVSLYHVKRLMSEHNSNELEWFPTRRQDWVLQIIMLPAVYATMSLRCVLRCWALMTGGGWTGEMAQLGWTFSEYASHTMDEYESNFALANFAEMYTLLCFSSLIVDMLKESIQSPELREAFSTLTMQGVLVFVVTGFAKVVVTLWLGWLRAYSRSGESTLVGVPFEKELGYLQNLDTFLGYSIILTSLQALYNIAMVCGLSPLQEINPTLKFLGTRILVIFAQLQSFCLQMGSMYRWLPINPFQAKLLHASLMCVECFGVAILHLFAWPDVDYHCGYLPLEDDPLAAERKYRRGSRSFAGASSRQFFNH